MKICSLFRPPNDFHRNPQEPKPPRKFSFPSSSGLHLMSLSVPAVPRQHRRSLVHRVPGQTLRMSSGASYGLDIDYVFKNNWTQLFTFVSSLFWEILTPTYLEILIKPFTYITSTSRLNDVISVSGFACVSIVVFFYCEVSRRSRYVCVSVIFPFSRKFSSCYFVVFSQKIYLKFIHVKWYPTPPVRSNLNLIL